MQNRPSEPANFGDESAEPARARLSRILTVMAKVPPIDDVPTDDKSAEAALPDLYRDALA